MPETENDGSVHQCLLERAVPITRPSQPFRPHGRLGHQIPRPGDGEVHQGCIGSRSEEHTSELQSLMRISSAVFSLKKTTLTSVTHTIKHKPQACISYLASLIKKKLK